MKKLSCFELTEKSDSGYFVKIEGNPIRIAEMIGCAVATLCRELPPVQRLMFQAAMAKSYEMEVKKSGETESAPSGEEF